MWGDPAPASIDVLRDLGRSASQAIEPDDTRPDELHAITGQMYAAVEAGLLADPQWPSDLDARRLAVAAHLAAVGVSTMEGLTPSDLAPS